MANQNLEKLFTKIKTIFSQYQNPPRVNMPQGGMIGGTQADIVLMGTVLAQLEPQIADIKQRHDTSQVEDDDAKTAGDYIVYSLMNQKGKPRELLENEQMKIADKLGNLQTIILSAVEGAISQADKTNAKLAQASRALEELYTVAKDSLPEDKKFLAEVYTESLRDDLESAIAAA